MRCNNDHDLLALSFVPKISVFLEATLEPYQRFMMEFFGGKIVSC